MPGTVFLVATPIGNLNDITLRALEVLKNVDLVACEDTRHTGKLLKHFGISKKLVSYHEHNEIGRADELSAMLADGKSIAVVSDAGTPGIADPGFRFVRKAIEIGASVVPIPGPVAFVAAAIASGLSTDALFFGGFLPSKKAERRRRLQEIAEIPATLVFYEAPHRLGKSLADCFEVLGDRQAVIARELTKLHEEIIRGSLAEISASYSNANIKGEIVLLIDRNRGLQSVSERSENIVDRVNELISSGEDRKVALKRAAKEFGLSKAEAYRQVQAEKNTGSP
jgi:probable S-adenosylmethionine-dependent methyltransferase, YraL family